MRGKFGLGWGTLLCPDGGDHMLGVLLGCWAERKDVRGEGEFSTSKSILGGFQLFLWGLGSGGPSALACSVQVMLLHPSKVKESPLQGEAASLRHQQPEGIIPRSWSKGRGFGRILQSLDYAGCVLGREGRTGGANSNPNKTPLYLIKSSSTLQEWPTSLCASVSMGSGHWSDGPLDAALAFPTAM